MNFKPLKQKDFALLMFGKLVSLIGTQMQNFALSLYVLKITGSATKFASVLAVTILPSIILGPIAGVLADWFDRKKIIVYLDMIRGIIIGIYAVIFVIKGELTLGSIYGLVIIMSISSLLFQPAIGTVIPSIVEKDDLMEANGVNSLIMNIGNLISPVIAGILFGIYGLSIILIINSISFILSSLSELLIKIPKVNKKPEKINMKAFINDFNEGITFIKSKKILISIIYLALIINFVISPLFSVGLTYISKEILEVTDSQYGIMEAVLVIAMMISPFIVSTISKKMKLGKLIFMNILICSFLTLIFAIIPSFIFMSKFESNLIPYISMIVIIFAIILILGIVNIGIATMFQKEVPLEMMGRTMTVMNSVCMAAMPLGQLLLGVSFDKIQPWIVISICSIFIFITIMTFRKNLIDSDNIDNVDNVKETPIVN